MTVVAVEITLAHPPHRVWRALTDPALLGQWFAKVASEPSDQKRFRVPEGLSGVDGPVDATVLTADEPHKLVLALGPGPGAAELSWHLSPTTDGCRLVVRLSGLADTGDPDRLPRLRGAYRTALDKRLTTLLDRLAADAGDLRPRGDNSLTVLLDAVPAARRPARRRVAALVAAAVLVLAVLAGGTAWLLRPPADPPPVAAPPAGGSVPLPVVPPATVAPTPTATPTASSVARSTSAAPVRSVSPSPTPVRTATLGPGPSPSSGEQPRLLPAALIARYTTTDSKPGSYLGRIDVTNDASVRAPTWEVVLTVHPGHKVVQTKGARVRSDRETITFTAVDDLGPGETAVFSFEVVNEDRADFARPRACTIEGRRCDGV